MIHIWDNIIIGQKLAWIFSTISNGLWLFVFIPQLYQNYKNNNSRAISLVLLFCLMLGDILSIISAYLKQLNIVIIYAGLYHIILNTIIIGQIIYYRKKFISQYGVISNEITPLIANNSEDNYNNILLNEYTKYSYFYLTFFELLFIIVNTILITSSQLFIFFNSTYNDVIANIIAWMATFIFMIARVPQILLNFKRKSTNGLSLLSFIIINISNMFFLMSVLILLYDINPNHYLDYIISNIQWIVGSSSTTLFDGIIFYQFYKYRNNNMFEYI